MAITPISLGITIATTGTAVQVTASTIHCTTFYAEAGGTNSGIIYFGASATVAYNTVYISALAAYAGYSQKTDNSGFGAKPISSEFKLSDYYVNGTAGDVVYLTYFPRIGSYP